MNDTDWMRLALDLARRGRGFVEPNPMVGAVVVREGRAVGEGWHRRYGEAHAEVHALAQAGESARGATLYVTLEPCCHWGKTAPCADAVIRAEISRVAAAMADPFPKVAGGGIQQLKDAGITVDVGILEADARRLNAPYLTLLSKQRPYIHAKWAMTLDGKIATRTGHSQWISGEESRRRVHDLRGRVDAIIVGAGTVRADDPQLTARPPGPRAALRVVLSRRGDLPPRCRLLQTARDIPVLIAGSEIGEPQRQTLESFGCQVLTMDLPHLIAELGRRRMTNLLVEGGAAMLGSFRDANAIDEVHVFIAPILMGGVQALSPVAGAGATTIGDGLRLTAWTCDRSGDDWYVNGTIDGNSA
jgi:diaminohydroxyphosphoribosylaminopyrimidine deaminase/5-amino-6-(5-phosphoribosylamino)uracil reductase